MSSDTHFFLQEEHGKDREDNGNFLFVPCICKGVNVRGYNSISGTNQARMIIKPENRVSVLNIRTRTILFWLALGESKAISYVGTISLLAVLLGISAVGIYLAYSTSHPIVSANSLVLQSFSITPASSTVTGKVRVNSNSQLSTMRLYVNGTYLGYYNYSYMRSMMSSMMGSSYPYEYSMLYSASRASMPMFANYPFMTNRVYNVTMMATFGDGSTCYSYVMVHT